jgi:hypothetical protein
MTLWPPARTCGGRGRSLAISHVCSERHHLVLPAAPIARGPRRPSARPGRLGDAEAGQQRDRRDQAVAEAREQVRVPREGAVGVDPFRVLERARS